jgi:hypothetical protein
VGLVVIVVAVLLVIAVVVVQQQLKAKRLAALRAVAYSRRLEFAEGDERGSLALPFSLFAEGDKQGIDWTMWDDHHRVVEFWYYTTSRDAQGHQSRTYHRFTGVIADLGSRWPHLRIHREGFLRGLRDALGFKDIQFESEEFNRQFKVTCGDARFASAFVDARMMAFLLDTASGAQIEVSGGHTLCAVSRLVPDQVGALIDYGAQFEAHIPAVVRELYP